MTAEPPSDAKSARLAAALRANLRRRKAPSRASVPAGTDAPHGDGGVDDGEALYPHSRGDAEGA